ncbi:MAG: DUF1634 domain-containing protein [Chloroflexi bacterium]|nr:DUF1634 domain-containing protein [Chloroflexota bacterium]MCL5951253.1 DUF1634 domain-containing protein [Chloroflexota bacterium]
MVTERVQVAKDEAEVRAIRRVQSGESDMEILIGYILQVGVLLSVAFILLGIAWRWLATGAFTLEYSITGMNFFEFVLEDLRQVALGAFRPRLWVNLGIATLMLTPYVRVLASMIFFAVVERNWKYTLFTAFVFTVLTYSLFLR